MHQVFTFKHSTEFSDAETGQDLVLRDVFARYAPTGIDFMFLQLFLDFFSLASDPSLTVTNHYCEFCYTTQFSSYPLTFNTNYLCIMQTNTLKL